MSETNRTRKPGDDEGSTLLLTIFFACLSLALILVVVAATSLYLERKRLFTLADGAALAAAESFALDAVDITGTETRPMLRSAEVAAAARRYLASAPHPAFDGLELSRAISVDGRSATVSLGARWRPPALALILPAGVPLEVTAIARSVFD